MSYWGFFPPLTLTGTVCVNLVSFSLRYLSILFVLGLGAYAALVDTNGTELKPDMPPVPLYPLIPPISTAFSTIVSDSYSIPSRPVPSRVELSWAGLEVGGWFALDVAVAVAVVVVIFPRDPPLGLSASVCNLSRTYVECPSTLSSCCASFYVRCR